MQERIESKRARYWFESLSELAQYLDRTPKTWKNSNSSTDGYSGKNWDLNTSYTQAWSLARNGWIEGAQRAQEALKVFAPMTPAPDTRVDFYGHMPHVARYCAGAPDNMIRHTPAPTMGVWRIIVPVNAVASVGAEHMANFGVAVAQYLNQLETQGIRCEIVGAIVSQVSGWRVSHCWRIKHADQPLDLAVLAFAVGHPAMFRRLGFALRERCAAPRDSSYGRTVDAKLDDCINAPSGAVILNGMARANEVARTPEAALAYITKQIDAVLENPEARSAA